jgi:hypothetical protein
MHRLLAVIRPAVLPSRAPAQHNQRLGSVWFFCTMNFALVLSVIVLLGVALAYWLMQRQALQAAAAHQQNVLFDQMFRAAQHRAPSKTAAPQRKAARINPAPNPLRELALCMYESHGYRRVRARASEAPVQFWLRQPGQAASAYALLELEYDERVSAPHLSALAQRLPSTQDRVLVLCKQGFTRDAKAMAKQINVKLIDNKTLKRKLTGLPVQQQTLLLTRVKRNLGEQLH